MISFYNYKNIKIIREVSMQSKFNPNFKLEENSFVISVVSLTKRQNNNRLLFVIEGYEKDPLTFNLQPYYREYLVLHSTEKNIILDKMVDTITIQKQVEDDYPPSIIQPKGRISFYASAQKAKHVATLIENDISIFREAAGSKIDIEGLNPRHFKYALPEGISNTHEEWCSGKLAAAGVIPIEAPELGSKECCSLA